MAENKQSLFERLGGEAALKAVVEEFYVYILADDRVNHFFKGENMVSLKERQRTFLAMVTGGPNQYKGKSLKEAHKKLKINEQHFNVIAELLTKALEAKKVPQQLIDELITIVLTTKQDVVNSKL